MSVVVLGRCARGHVCAGRVAPGPSPLAVVRGRILVREGRVVRGTARAVLGDGRRWSAADEGRPAGVCEEPS